MNRSSDQELLVLCPFALVWLCICASIKASLKGGREGKIEKKGGKVRDGERGRPVCAYRKQKDVNERSF